MCSFFWKKKKGLNDCVNYEKKTSARKIVQKSFTDHIYAARTQMVTMILEK